MPQSNLIKTELMTSLKAMIDAYSSDDGHGPIAVIETAKLALARAKQADEDIYRLTRYRAALNHWTKVGFTFETARALAAVLHGENEDVKAWARSYVSRMTNLRTTDMI